MTQAPPTTPAPEAASGRTTEDIAEYLALLPQQGRLIGIDAGTKTLGLALSDVTRTIASPVETIARRSKAVAADLQRLVDDAKNPERPGDWSPELAADTRAAAVRRVRRLEPLACRVVLDALDGDAAALDELIGTHVEEAVRALRTPVRASP